MGVASSSSHHQPVDSGGALHGVLDEVPEDVLERTGGFLKPGDTALVCRDWSVHRGSRVNQVLQLPARAPH